MRGNDDTRSQGGHVWRAIVTLVDSELDPAEDDPREAHHRRNGRNNLGQSRLPFKKVAFSCRTTSKIAEKSGRFLEILAEKYEILDT